MTKVTFGLEELVLTAVDVLYFLVVIDTLCHGPGQVAQLMNVFPFTVIYTTCTYLKFRHDMR